MRPRPVRGFVGLIIVLGLATVVVGGDASLSSGAQTSSPGWATASEIDRFLQKERADLKLSGLAVVVISQRSIIFERGYGDAAPEGPAVTLNTPFVLGSTSKQLTGLAVQQLIAQGRLKRPGFDAASF